MHVPYYHLQRFRILKAHSKQAFNTVTASLSYMRGSIRDSIARCSRSHCLPTINRASLTATFARHVRRSGVNACPRDGAQPLKDLHPPSATADQPHRLAGSAPITHRRQEARHGICLALNADNDIAIPDVGEDLRFYQVSRIPRSNKRADDV